MKSLRNTGNVAAARACVKYSGAPWKYDRSVSTDKQVAPPRSKLAAIAVGSKLARNTPLLGLAFLISAITADSPAAIFARNAPSKSRGGGAARAARSVSANGRTRLAAAISSALVARIRVRMSD